MRSGSDLIRTWSCSLLGATHHPLPRLGAPLFLSPAWAQLCKQLLIPVTKLCTCDSCSPVLPQAGAQQSLWVPQPSDPCKSSPSPETSAALTAPIPGAAWAAAVILCPEASKIITGSVLVSIPELHLGLRSTGSVTHCHLNAVGGKPSTDFLSSYSPLDLHFSLSCCTCLMGTVTTNQHCPASYSPSPPSPAASLERLSQPFLLPARSHTVCGDYHPGLTLTLLAQPGQSTCARAAPAPWPVKPFPVPGAPALTTTALTHIPPCSSGNRLISCSLITPLPWLPENRGLYLYF